jgi:RNA polymerase sigma-54 factor
MMELTSQQDMRLGQHRSLAMTTQLRQAIGLLKFNNAELINHLAVLASENPAISLVPDPLCGLPRKLKRETPAQANPVESAGGTAATEATLAQPPSGLHDHVRTQIGLSFRNSRERAIAEAFCESLEPSGWLREPVAEVARRIRASIDEAEVVLTKLQQLEPTGIFARNLAECLRLQAADQGLLTTEMAKVLENLHVLAKGAVDDLARLCSVSEAEIHRIVGQIRRFNPKPGAAFALDATPARTPDLIVTAGGSGVWNVELNRSTTPRVVVREAALDGLVDDDARRKALAEAHWLERAVSRRNATTLRIGGAVVQRQSEFFRLGPAGLTPLSFADVADVAGVHESTVSRISAGLMISTPRGTIPLRELFSVALPRIDGGAMVSAGAVRHAIRCLIAAEDPSCPLSDSAIAQRLQLEAGARIARRTVAKYRDMMRIPGSSTRRAQARLAPMR